MQLSNRRMFYSRLLLFQDIITVHCRSSNLPIRSDPLYPEFYFEMEDNSVTVVVSQNILFLLQNLSFIYLDYVNVDWVPLCRCIFVYANIWVMHAVVIYSPPNFGFFLFFLFWLRIYFYQLPAGSLLLFRKFQIPAHIHSNQLGSVRKEYFLCFQKWVSS